MKSLFSLFSLILLSHLAVFSQALITTSDPLDDPAIDSFQVVSSADLTKWDITGTLLSALELEVSQDQSLELVVNNSYGIQSVSNLLNEYPRVLTCNLFLGSLSSNEQNILDTSMAVVVASSTNTNGSEYIDFVADPNTSISNALVGAQLLEIKTQTNLSWDEVLQKARETASNPIRNNNTGYGFINVEAAINSSKRVNLSVGDEGLEVSYLNVPPIGAYLGYTSGFEVNPIPNNSYQEIVSDSVIIDATYSLIRTDQNTIDRVFFSLAKYPDSKSVKIYVPTGNVTLESNDLNFVRWNGTQFISSTSVNINSQLVAITKIGNNYIVNPL